MRRCADGASRRPRPACSGRAAMTRRERQTGQSEQKTAAASAPAGCRGRALGNLALAPGRKHT
eukprot:7219422-Alexandrium_andersonii.AAC.1